MADEKTRPKNGQPEDTEDPGESIESCGPRAEVGSLPEQTRRIPAFRCANYDNYTWSPIDPDSSRRLAELDPVSRCEYEKLGYLPELRRVPLGTFQTDDHSAVVFEAIPEIGEVAYSEVSEYPSGTAKAPDLADNTSASPLLRFLQVTDKTVPVPLMLSEFDDRNDDPEVEKLIAKRDLVDALDDYGRQFVAAPTPVASSSEPSPVWTCFTGGLNTFAATYCQNKDISYCDNGAWLDLTRSTGNKTRYVSHSRIACCSNYGAYVEHQYRFWSWTYWKWKWTTVKYPLPPAAWWQTLGFGDVKYWKHVGNKKRRRKIRVWTGGNTGYFRSWTAFYN
ncbi:hypothetical protein KUH32_09505 [Thalassococcus sp. CAU 1522]|uniref:Uncharacterized protein n=1 Tax=Thalassococcus arenae TaxID=2851652 RepID=A0ABS6N7L5_9RHOB|nr:hypothetical protein [Thalassococcus arenae]MBV2360010.1 hypothetical protein [Thalassococcus arenae]